MRLLVASLFAGLAAAENGLAAWLRYAPVGGAQHWHNSLPSHIVALNSTIGSPVYTAGQELEQGIQSIYGKQCQVHHGHWGSGQSSLIVGTVDEYVKAYGKLRNAPKLIEDGFWLSTEGNNVQILGQNERGALYGAFEYLSMIAQGNFSKVAYADNPDAPIRWTNEWDNLDGSIERGFAGKTL
jgi:alpha-glucuronidase